MEAIGAVKFSVDGVRCAYRIIPFISNRDLVRLDFENLIEFVACFFWITIQHHDSIPKLILCYFPKLLKLLRHRWSQKWAWNVSKAEAFTCYRLHPMTFDNPQNRADPTKTLQSRNEQKLYAICYNNHAYSKTQIERRRN